MICQMRYFTTLTLIGMLFIQAQAQDTMTAPVQQHDIAIHYDVNTGEINLLNNQSKHKITEDYLLEQLELEIYDATGQYAGSLELNNFHLSGVPHGKCILHLYEMQRFRLHQSSPPA